MCPTTNFGKFMIANRLGSNVSFISYMAVGSGSGTFAVTDNILNAEWGRQAITGSPDFSTTYHALFTADWNSVQASGLILREFAPMASGTALTGSIWAREAFAAVTMDGTNELRIEYDMQVV